MANSPAHRFGQIIGDLLEEIMVTELQAFCAERQLYLDRKGVRGKARKGSKVTWEDRFGNLHDLDFVIEQGGSSDHRGRPLAFIEAAWRRYTKHSRNKAQEIQGTVLPIAEKHAWDKPFLGVVLAGIFTSGSLAQMESSGFEVLLFPYPTIVDAFQSIGIDVKFDEATPDNFFKVAVARIEKLSSIRKETLKTYLLKKNKNSLTKFFDKLTSNLDRKVVRVFVIPVHGHQNEFASIRQAQTFIQNYDERALHQGKFHKYEIIVGYSNGDRIEANFSDKTGVLEFLKYIAESGN